MTGAGRNKRGPLRFMAQGIVVIATALIAFAFISAVPQFALMHYLHRFYGIPLQFIGDRGEFILLSLLTAFPALAYGLLWGIAVARRFDKRERENNAVPADDPDRSDPA